MPEKPMLSQESVDAENSVLAMARELCDQDRGTALLSEVLPALVEKGHYSTNEAAKRALHEALTNGDVTFNAWFQIVPRPVAPVE